MERLELDAFRLPVLDAANRIVDQVFCHVRKPNGMVEGLTRKGEQTGNIMCQCLASDGGLIPGIEPRLEVLNIAALLLDDPYLENFPDCYGCHIVEPELCHMFHRQTMQVCQPDQGALRVHTTSIACQAIIQDDVRWVLFRRCQQGMVSIYDD